MSEGDRVLVDPAIGQFGGGGLFVGHALDVERVADVLQACGIGALPAGLRKPVMLAGENDQPRREVVHPQVQRAVDSALALNHAEHLECVLPPRRDVGGLKAQITE